MIIKNIFVWKTNQRLRMKRKEIKEINTQKMERIQICKNKA